MTFTHEQFAMAVEQVGRHGQPFSSAAVRACLGMTANDKRTLTRFNYELHAYHKSSGGRVERLAKNRYRLRSSERAAAPSAQPLRSNEDADAEGPSPEHADQGEAFSAAENISERPVQATVHTFTKREDGQIRIRIIVRHAPRADDFDLPWAEEDDEPAPAPSPPRGALNALLGPMLRVFSR